MNAAIKTSNLNTPACVRIKKYKHPIMRTVRRAWQEFEEVPFYFIFYSGVAFSCLDFFFLFLFLWMINQPWVSFTPQRDHLFFRGTARLSYEMMTACGLHRHPLRTRETWLQVTAEHELWILLHTTSLFFFFLPSKNLWYRQQISLFITTVDTALYIIQLTVRFFYLRIFCFFLKYL